MFAFLCTRKMTLEGEYILLIQSMHSSIKLLIIVSWNHQSWPLTNCTPPWTPRPSNPTANIRVTKNFFRLAKRQQFLICIVKRYCGLISSQSFINENFSRFDCFLLRNSEIFAYHAVVCATVADMPRHRVCLINSSKDVVFFSKNA